MALNQDMRRASTHGNADNSSGRGLLVQKGTLSAIKQKEFVRSRISYLIQRHGSCNIVLHVEVLNENICGQINDSSYGELEGAFYQFLKKMKRWEISVQRWGEAIFLSDSWE